jgi:membrane protease YdiL (CAAX protease family)
MLLIPVYILMDDNKISSSLKKLGFNGGVLRAFLIALVSLVPAFILMFILALSANYLGINDSQKVDAKVTALPLYVLLYATTIGPLAEEIFFRSFLSKYLNSILVNILFAFAHVSYGSVYEIIGAFALGMYLYILYKVSGDIKTSIFAHMFINIVALYFMFSS